MSLLVDQDPQVAEAIRNEIQRQRQNINLIASENYASAAVLEAQGSVLTNKYAEGYPGRRYYGGCEFVDVAERLAIERAKDRGCQTIKLDTDESNHDAIRLYQRTGFLSGSTRFSESRQLSFEKILEPGS